MIKYFVVLCLSLLLVDLHRCALTQQRKLCIWTLCQLWHSKVVLLQEWFLCIILVYSKKIWTLLEIRQVTGVLLHEWIFFWWTFFFFFWVNYRSDFYSLYIPQVYMQLTISICLIEYFYSLEMCRVIYIGQNKGFPAAFILLHNLSNTK